MASSSKGPPETYLKQQDALPKSPHNIFSKASNEISRVSITSKSSSESGESAHAPETHTGGLDVDNPFERDNDKELAEKVRTFADTDSGLDEYFKLLNCGAQLAKDQKNALANEALFGHLSKEQKEYFENGNKDGEEHAGFWGQSKYLKGSVLSACLAGIIQGWTQSAMNGANLGIMDEFDLHYKRLGNGQGSNRDLWIFGVLNAIPFLAGGLLAPLLSDPMQEYFLGRRGAIAFASVLTIAGTIGQSFSRSIVQIIGCRIIIGLALAAKASSAPLLTGEVAPNHLRGNLLSTWQLSDAFGIFLGFSSNLATLHIRAPAKIVWRIQIATTLIPTIVLLFLVYFMPESPRYLMKRGRPVKALDAFTMLRPSPVSRLLAARDLVYAHFQLQMECESIIKRREFRVARKLDAKQKTSRGVAKVEETEKGQAKGLEKGVKQSPKNEKESKLDLENQGSTGPETPLYVTSSKFFGRMKQTFNDARSRRALVCASTAMISQQLTGINTIAFLSNTLLRTVNASDRTGAWLGFGIGICNFVFGVPAFWLLDYLGRATLLLLGFVPMFVLMLILAFSFKEGVEGDARVPLVGVFGILYIIAYSPTAGTSPFAISAEVFPLVVREVGHSLAVAVNFLGLGFVLLVFPFLSGKMGGYRESLSFFAGLNLVAFILCFLFVPETKGRSLEELRSIFDIPTKEHISYRLKYVAPWLWRRILRLEAARVPSWLKPKTTGNAQGNTEGVIEENGQGVVEANVNIGFLDFRGWYAGEIHRRAIEARQ